MCDRKAPTNTAKDVFSLIADAAETCLKRQHHTKQNSEQHTRRWKLPRSATYSMRTYRETAIPLSEREKHAAPCS